MTEYELPRSAAAAPESPRAGPLVAALPTRSFLIAILLLSLAIRLPAFFIPHAEYDELIYQTLADKVSHEFLDYSLRGTEVLKKLPAEIFDTPLYERPPLFVYLLALFRSLLGVQWGILLPIVTGVLTILAVYAVAKQLYDEQRAILSAFVLACCPVLLFGSVRILIDSLLALLVTSTIWLCVVAAKKRKSALFALAGALFGFTILTKETGCLTLLVCLFVLFKDGVQKEKLKFFALYVCCAAIVATPWYLYFYKTVGTFFVWRSSISPRYMEMFPFVRIVALRPWYFYVQNLTLCAPVYVLAWIGILLHLKNRKLPVEVVWALAFLVPLTVLGLRGQGYQTRYLLPGIPALAILSAQVLARRNAWVWTVGVALLGIGVLTGILNCLMSKPADVFPVSHYLAELTR